MSGLLLDWNGVDNGGPFRVTKVVDFATDFPGGGVFHASYALRPVVLGAGVLACLFEWTDPNNVLKSFAAVGIPDLLVVGSDVGQFTFWKASAIQIPAAIFRVTMTKTLGGGGGSTFDLSLKVLG